MTPRFPSLRFAPSRRPARTRPFCPTVAAALLLIVLGTALSVAAPLLAASADPWTVGQEPAPTPRREALILHSYQPGYIWTDDVMRGMRSALDRIGPGLFLHVEHMNSKNFHDDVMDERFYEIFRRKYADRRIEVILTSDENAFRFMLRFRDRLFPTVPVVFCGVNDFQPDMLAGRTGFTGVVEDFDMERNLNLARSFRPDATKVAVIGDETSTNLGIKAHLRDLAPRFAGQLEFEFWPDEPLDRIVDKASRLGGEYLIYYINLHRDRDGGVYVSEEALDRLSRVASVPIYSNWTFLLGHGIVGGLLCDSFEQGRVAGDMAARILSGENPAAIPVVMDSPNIYRFDYDALKRFGISAAKLPAMSDVVNEPDPFYHLDKQAFRWLVAAMGALVVFSLLLSASILKRKTVERALTESEERLRVIFEAAEDVSFIIVEEGDEPVVAEFSPGAERIFGHARDEVIGRSISVLGLPQEALRPLDRDLAGSGLKAEAELRRKNGERFLALFAAYPLSAAKSGRPMALLVCLDITERKKAEEDLRLAEEKYRSIFENSALGIFRSTFEGRYLDVNPAMARLLGFDSPAEVLATVKDLFLEFYVDPSRRDTLIQAVSQSASVVRFENTYRARDGRIIAANLYVRLERGADGEVRYMEGFVEDITKSKEAEAALKESQERLQRVLDALPQLVAWKDARSRYLWANQAFASFFGLDADAGVAGMTDADLFPDADDAQVSEELDNEVMIHGQPEHRAKWRITSPAGRDVWLETSRIPMRDGEGVMAGLLVVSEDISEKIGLERQLLQSQKMEAIGAMAGGIAHDFNNILTSVINSIELALPDAPEGGLARRDLERALRASHRGSQLVKQILAFSRASKEELRRVDLAEVVEETLQMLEPSLPRNIKVKRHLPLRRITALADPTQIQQVFVNIVANAFQAMRRAGGVLEARLEEAEVSPEAGLITLKPGPYARVTLADTGPGIDPDVIDKIFDPFFTTKDKGEGTGLGLSVAHGIVKAHGGTIDVDNRPGRGVSFHVWLPRLDQAGDAPVMPSAELGLGRSGVGKTVLFVEDDEDQLYAIPRVLEQLGCAVIAQRDPVEALELFRQQPSFFTLILTDFDMPGKNGIELARDVFAISPDTPVLLVTGRRMAAEQAGQAPSIRAILTKPYGKAELAQAMRGLFEGKNGGDGPARGAGSEQDAPPAADEAAGGQGEGAALSLDPLPPGA